MSRYERVKRCRECGKIYPGDVPELCHKCGTRLGWVSNYLSMLYSGHRIINFTNKVVTITAKKTLFGWKIREESKQDDEGDI